MTPRGEGDGTVGEAAALDGEPAPAPVGLRERKREETRRRIILAARVGSLDAGIDGLTIDAIAREADISPRSFFNYFPNKEAAIAGVIPGTARALTADELDQLPADVVDAVVAIVVAVLGRQVDSTNTDLRREVFVRFPELLDEFRPFWKASVRTAAVSVTDLLLRRGSTAESSAVVAPVLVAMCVSVVRTMLARGELDSVELAHGVRPIADAIRSTAEVVTGGPRGRTS
ncbi:hypothetical protein DEJ16_02245 [Curtobacterium sp. MCJR17_055]|nr:hypothetical protein DEI87_03900 [Curtobacterium sp. MCBD17_029]PYY58074.1 hypothetical protein DEJ26_10935 [Curtobacterium sp. MCPF17_015]PYY58524.1 hypothetical protein DEJ16_02245 [Curtobacterium sp. MCJR17_055]